MEEVLPVLFKVEFSNGGPSLELTQLIYLELRSTKTVLAIGLIYLQNRSARMAYINCSLALLYFEELHSRDLPIIKAFKSCQAFSLELRVARLMSRDLQV